MMDIIWDKKIIQYQRNNNQIIFQNIKSFLRLKPQEIEKQVKIQKIFGKIKKINLIQIKIIIILIKLSLIKMILKANIS
jgi:hypothetical protein